MGRLKETPDRHPIGATVSLNGSVCKSYPRIVEACLKSGWELMGHSPIHRPMYLEPHERESLRKTIATIREASGEPPRGWMGPGLTETWDARGADAAGPGAVRHVYAEGRTNTCIMAIAVHPCLSGMPHRIEYSDQIFAT